MLFGIVGGGISLVIWLVTLFSKQPRSEQTKTGITKNLPANMPRKVLWRCFLVFGVIALAGVALMLAFYHHLHAIEVSCGLGVNPHTRWITHCTNAYAAHHMGVRPWWGLILPVGVGGLLLSLIAWLVMVVSKHSRS
jgi:hypothetical protein